MTAARPNVTARVVALTSREAAESRVEGTAAERLALVAELSLRAWCLTGRPLPTYTRATIPMAIRPLRAPAVSVGPDEQ